MQENRPAKITGIGNTLVDILINESDQFLIDLKKEKGGMTLVEYEDIEYILSQTKKKPAIVPGGSTCNTIVGIGKLGLNAGFIGSRGDDANGELFVKELQDCGVEPMVQIATLPTGNSLSVVTPDAQRSMFTFLGASTQLEPGSITSEMFKGSRISMIEGYLLFNRELIMAALKAAKAAGSLIALDLSSFEVIDAAKDILEDMIKDYVDILIANDDEAKAYTGYDDELKAIEKLSEHVSYAVLKVGKRGSYISHQKKVTRIKAQTGNAPIDTTGAGDLWAAGFLFGIANNFSMEKCGQIASACGYEVCQVIGAQIPETAWKRIKRLI